MRKTILQLDIENKLKIEKRNQILDSLLCKYFLRFEGNNIYLYYLCSGLSSDVYIINLEDYTITEKYFHKNLILEHLEHHDCFEINVNRECFIERILKFKYDVYKYADIISKQVNRLMLGEEKVFSSYPKLYKYDENKLIVNNETKNLTLDEYKNYIDKYNSLKLESWTCENKKKLANVGKFAIAFNHARQQKGNIIYYPRLFGKISKNTINKKYSIEPKSIFYGGDLFCKYEKNSHGNIGYSHLIVLELEELNHFKMLWYEFIHFIIKNTNKNKIDY